MATFFAQQRPTRGMAGFKFRKRTKSKYDRPKHQTFIEQMNQQLADKKQSNQSGGPTSRKKYTKKHRSKQPSNLDQSEQITTDDLKKFFTQLTNTSSVLHRNQPTHSRLTDSFDLKKESLRAHQATLNHQKALRDAAQQRLLVLAAETDEDCGTPCQETMQDILQNQTSDKEGTTPDVMLNKFSPYETMKGAMQNQFSKVQPILQLKPQELTDMPVSTERDESNRIISKQNSGLVWSADSRSGLPVIESNYLLQTKSAAAMAISPLNNAQSSQDLKITQSRQKLRLSAEGLVDIVTEQYIDGTLTDTLKKANLLPKADDSKGRSSQAAQDDPRDQNEVKPLGACLTPILTENSSAKQQQRDSSPDGHKHSAEDLQSVPQSQTQTEGEEKRNQMSPELHQMISKKSFGRGVQDYPHQTQTSKLSQRSQYSFKRSVFSHRKSMSLENLGTETTPCLVEARCDNEDLQLINEKVNEKSAGGERIESGSRLAKKSGDKMLNTSTNFHQKFSSLRPNVPTRFKRRLQSAGPSKYTAAANILCRNPSKQAVTRENLHARCASGKHLGKNLSGLQTLAAAQHMMDDSLAKMKVKSNDKSFSNQLQKSQTQHQPQQNFIDLNVIEINTDVHSRQAIKQYKTLNLSEKSNALSQERAIEAASQKQMHDTNSSEKKLLSPPSVKQLARCMLKNFHDNQGQLQQNGPQDMQEKCKDHQRLIDAELCTLKAKITDSRGSTPQLAFVEEMGQLQMRGDVTAAEHSLKFFEEVMQKHFKYGILADAQTKNFMCRPILSTRQAYQTILSQKLQEQKVLDTLQNENQRNKYNEFRNAQQVAAAMMDFVSSASSGNELQPRIGEMDVLPRDKFGPNGQIISNWQNTPKAGEIDVPRTQEDKQSKTVSLEVKSRIGGARELNQCSPKSPRQKSPDEQMQTQEASIKNEAKIDWQNEPLPRTPLSRANERLNSTDKFDSDRISIDARPQVVPAKLDIVLQENVERNIANHNQKIVESRRKMAQRRTSRPDTLNQLVSPRDHFEMTHPAYQNSGTKPQLTDTQTHAITINTVSQKSRNTVHRSRSTTPNADLSPCQSHQKTYDRKILIKHQGGGFNRSPCSGYFKRKQLNGELASPKPRNLVATFYHRSTRSLQNRTLSNKTKKQATVKPSAVYVEERPQILANEVWSSRNRGMPYKVVLQVQQKSDACNEIGRTTFAARVSEIQRKSASPRGAHGDFLTGADAKLKKKGEATIEVFPFSQKEKLSSKETSKSAARFSTSNARSTKIMPISPGQDGKQQNYLHPSKIRTSSCVHSLKTAFDRQLLSSHGNAECEAQPILASINEQYSEGQHTISNRHEIVDFRYSQIHNTYDVNEVAQESTVNLRGSYTAMDEVGSKKNKVKLGETTDEDCGGSQLPLLIISSSSETRTRNARKNSSSKSKNAIKIQHYPSTTTKRQETSQRLVSSHPGANLNTLSPRPLQGPTQSADPNYDKLKKAPQSDKKNIVKLEEIKMNNMMIRRSSEGQFMSQLRASQISELNTKVPRKHDSEGGDIERESTKMKAKGEQLSEEKTKEDLKQSADVAANTSALCKKPTTEVSRLSHHNYNMQKPLSKDGKSIVLSSSSMEATEGGARRRSVLKKASLKAILPTEDFIDYDLYQEGLNGATYRVQLSPTSCGEVLVQDSAGIQNQYPKTDEGREAKEEPKAPEILSIDRRSSEAEMNHDISEEMQHQLTKVRQSKEFTIKESIVVPPEQNTSNALCSNAQESMLTTPMWQPEVIQNTRGKPPLRRKRPQTSHPSNPVRVGSNSYHDGGSQSATQESCSHQPRQIIYQNGKKSNVKRTLSKQSSWKGGATPAEQSTRQARLSFNKSSKQNMLNTNNMNSGELSQIMQSNSTKQSRLHAQPESNVQRRSIQQRSSKPNTVRLTFTQGVSQLIRNFDKKFIVENVSLPIPDQAASDLVMTQRKILFDRNPQVSSSRHRRASMVGRSANDKAFITANITNQLKNVSSIREIATQTLTVEDVANRGSPDQASLERGHLRQVSPARGAQGQGSPSWPLAKSVRNVGCLTQRIQLARSKSKAPQTAKNSLGFDQSIQRSPVVQKTFDADVGLTQVQPTVMCSSNYSRVPSFNAVAILNTKSPAKSLVNNKTQPQTLIAERVSLNSSTTIGTSQAANNNKRAKFFTKTGSLANSQAATNAQLCNLNHEKRMLRQFESQKHHPLDFLAQAAVESTKDIVSSRNDGLIINDRRKLLTEDDSGQISDLTQTLATKINLSLVPKGADANDLESKGSLASKTPNHTSILNKRRQIRVGATNAPIQGPQLVNTHQHHSISNVNAVLPKKRTSLPEQFGQPVSQQLLKEQLLFNQTAAISNPAQQPHLRSQVLDHSKIFPSLPMQETGTALDQQQLRQDEPEEPNLNSTIFAHSISSQPFEREKAHNRTMTMGQQRRRGSQAASSNSLTEMGTSLASHNQHQQRKSLKSTSIMNVPSFAGARGVDRSTIQHFHQHALQNMMPAEIVNQYSKQVQKRVKNTAASRDCSGYVTAGSGKLSLTQKNIESLIKDIHNVTQYSAVKATK